MATGNNRFTPALPPDVFISGYALRSWMKSTRRLFKTLRCPICWHPSRVRRGFLLCDPCGIGWPLDDIQDLISEQDAVRLVLLGSPASSQPSPGSANPQSSDPGDNFDYEAHAG